MIFFLFSEHQDCPSSSHAQINPGKEGLPFDAKGEKVYLRVTAGRDPQIYLPIEQR